MLWHEEGRGGRGDSKGGGCKAHRQVHLFLPHGEAASGAYGAAQELGPGGVPAAEAAVRVLDGGVRIRIAAPAFDTLRVLPHCGFMGRRQVRSPGESISAGRSPRQSVHAASHRGSAGGGRGGAGTCSGRSWVPA